MFVATKFMVIFSAIVKFYVQILSQMQLSLENCFVKLMTFVSLFTSFNTIHSFFDQTIILKLISFFRIEPKS